MRFLIVVIGWFAIGAGAAHATSPAEVPAVALESAELLVAAFKFAGLAIGALSGLWALTRKLTIDDEQGHKRLTREGRISIALTVGSFLVAGAAASVELVAANLKRQNDLIAGAAIAAAEAEKSRREENARTQSLLIQNATLAEVSEARRRADAASAAERLLALENAAKEEKRDAQLALRVSRGTEANLARTQEALSELARVQQPLGLPIVELKWQIAAGTAEAAAMMKDLRELAVRARAGEGKVLEGLGLPPMAPEFASRLRSIVVKQGSPFYPGFGTILRDVVSATPSGSMFAVKNAKAGLSSAWAAEGNTPGGPLRRKGDIRFNFNASAPMLTYHIDEQLIEFQTSWKPTVWMDTTGDIMSIPDLELAMAIFDTGARFRPSPGGSLRTRLRLQLRPTRLSISANGRRFVLEQDRFRQVMTRDGYPLYVIDVIGKAGFGLGSHGPD